MSQLHTLLNEATRLLGEAGSPTPRLDAEVLLMHVLGIDRLRLLVEPAREVAGPEAEAFRQAVARRRRGEPVAYIRGEKEFWSLPFAVGPAVLIPRPETELLVEEALRRAGGAAAAPRIADIGTGSGAIAVALAVELPLARIVATDLSPEALAVAAGNAARHGVAGRIAFRQGDGFAGAEGPFDLVVSNPPYIAEAAYAGLAPGVRDFEPRLALAAGADGLDLYRRIVPGAAARLRPGGWLLLEIGEAQGAAVTALLAAAGFGEVAVRRDYAGLDRIVTGRR